MAKELESEINALFEQPHRRRVGNHQATVASKEANQTASLDKAPNLGWHLVSTQERVQLGRPAERPPPLLDGILALQAVALRRSAGANQRCVARAGSSTGQKKSKWTTLLLIDSQAVKNTCNARVESKGFCFYKSTNGIKRHWAVDSLGFPFFTHCTKANVSDDPGLIEMLAKNIDYFKDKPNCLPKITILLDNGYHPAVLTTALEEIDPQIMTKIQFELAPKPTPAQKQAQGKTGFVVVAMRWVIERTALEEGFPP